MLRVLRGTDSTVDVYDTNYEFQSHHRDNLGTVRQFGTTIGRIEFSKSGTRAAAAGTKPSNWRPRACPTWARCRPSCGASPTRTRPPPPPPTTTRPRFPALGIWGKTSRDTVFAGTGNGRTVADRDAMWDAARGGFVGLLQRAFKAEGYGALHPVLATGDEHPSYPGGYIATSTGTR